ncbi:MAG: hypothetical protein E6J20_17850, partial [Chloroflexi bacterium]
ITGPNQTTNASGIAAATSWTLGTTAGANTVTATSGTLAGSPVTFTATGTAGAATTMVKFSGDNQVGQVGTQLATPHTVLITDANGNPVPNVTVTWAAASGGGSVNPTSSATDASGHASTTRTLGPTPGTQTTTAAATGLTTVTFSVTAHVGGATQMAINGGNLQTGTVGQTLPTPLSVIARDVLNNPVSGVTISWSVLDGGGSVNPLTSVTNSSGVASTSWTLGTAMTPTDSTQTAQATGVGSALSFTGFTVPGPVSAARTTVVASPASITASTGSGPSTITVTARDQFGNLIRGRTVVLTATGTLNTLIQPSPDTTNANGVASGTLSSTRAETKTVSATVGGTAITQQATVTVTPAAADTLVFIGQPSNVAAGAHITPAMQVEVRDQFGNRATAATVGIGLAIGTNPGGGVLTVTPRNAVSGVATFDDASIDRAGTGYTLVASSGALGPATSNAFNVTSAGAASIGLSAGNSQSATVGTAVAVAPSVIVRDQFNNPVAGVAVTFAVATGGGSVTGATQTTNGSGIATVTSWTLGPTAGPNTLTASSGTLTGSPVTFTATGTAGAASSIALNAGNGQSATAGTAVPVAPSVIVRDANGNPVAGVAVTFAVASGGGTVAPTTAVTSGTNGIATVTSWTLGPTAGPNTLTATATGLTGSPVTFTATGTAGTASSIAVNAGNGQSATAGTAVAVNPSVIVRDANGNPVGGVAVTFAVASGGGTVAPTTAVTTGTNGIATVTSWTLGPTAGPNTLTATATGLTGSPVTFTATGTAGTASSIAVNAGNGQSATAGTAVAVNPSVIVRDANGNPVGGVAVTFAVASGGGTVTPTTAVTTGTNGIATVTSWTLGPTAGPNTLTATSGTLTGSPVTFTATGTAGAASSMALNAGNGQSATAGTAVPVDPSVIVRDTHGNPVAGVAVTFAVASGGGTVAPTTAVTTGTNGIATVTSWTLGPTAGPNTLTASSGTLTGSPVTFTATGTAGAASSIAVNAGNGQSATAGTAVAVNPSVIVRDANGNPVGGVAVTFAVASGGGTVAPTTAVTTGANGIAAATSWTLGTTAGPNTLTATATGLTGSPVTFTATGTAGAATQVAVNAGNGQSATVGTAVAVNPSVIVRDTHGNPVGGVAVTFAVASGGGTVTPTTAVTTGTNGIATVTSWTLGPTAGPNTLTAT